MSQIFTLDFTYRHFVHSAIVTIRSQGCDHRVSAQLLGNNLRHIVPEGELSFRLSNATRQPAAAPRPGYNEVEQAIRAAVIRYLRHPAGGSLR